MNDPKVIEGSNEFKKVITKASLIDGEASLNESDDSKEEDGDGAEGFEVEENDDEYGSSGEKYGWYNGFSDDAIDDAFDGDPEATWNVD